MQGMDCYKFGCDENLKRIERMEGMDCYKCGCDENYTFVMSVF